MIPLAEGSFMHRYLRWIAALNVFVSHHVEGYMLYSTIELVSEGYS